jgi:DNA-binding phage protein
MTKSTLNPDDRATSETRREKLATTRLSNQYSYADNKDLVRLLRSEVEKAGGQSAWARREGIDRTLLNRVLNDQKPPSKEIIRALKLCNVYALDDDEAAY